MQKYLIDIINYVQVSSFLHFLRFKNLNIGHFGSKMGIRFIDYQIKKIGDYKSLFTSLES